MDLDDKLGKGEATLMPIDIDNHEEISLPVYIGALQHEYDTLVSKMSSNESWAYSFVALYFAFIASISAVSGLIVSTIFDTGSRSLFSVIFEPSAPSFRATAMGLTFSMNGLLIALSIIGVLLNVWAIGMVVEYGRSTQNLLKRLEKIEDELARCLARFGKQRFGFAKTVLEATFNTNRPTR